MRTHEATRTLIHAHKCTQVIFHATDHPISLGNIRKYIYDKYQTSGLHFQLFIGISGCPENETLSMPSTVSTYTIEPVRQSTDYGQCQISIPAMISCLTVV